MLLARQQEQSVVSLCKERKERRNALIRDAHNIFYGHSNFVAETSIARVSATSTTQFNTSGWVSASLRHFQTCCTLACGSNSTIRVAYLKVEGPLKSNRPRGAVAKASVAQWLRPR